MKKKSSWYIFLALFFTFPSFVFAQISISEIMYDLPGTEGSGEHDWIEVTNNDTESVDISGFKFFEAETNHGLKLDRGSAVLVPGAFAVIANATSTFLADWPNFNSTLFDSSFNLSSNGELLKICSSSCSAEGSIVEDNLTYVPIDSATNNGNSLQKVNGSFIATLPTPGVANISNNSGGANNSSTTDIPPNSETSGSQVSTQTPSSGGSAWKTDPQIYPNAGLDRTVLVGAEILFNGSALGIKKEPLTNARFSWNFGDGATKEGKNVLHVFRQPGEYVVTLDASSGEYSQGDSAIIIAAPATIRVGLFESGSNGFVEIINGGSADIDISGFKIKVATTTFAFPKGTIIRGGRSVRFSNEVTNLNPNGSPQLQYPNGSPLFLTDEIKTTSSTKTIQTVKSSNINVILPAVQKLNTLAEVSSSQSEVTSDVIENKNSKSASPITPWIVGLASLIGITSAGVLFLRRPSDPADEYEIIE